MKQSSLPSAAHSRNGFYPDQAFPRRRRHLSVMDWGGAIAVGILLSGLLFWALAVFGSGLWALLWVLDALMRRLGG